MLYSSSRAGFKLTTWLVIGTDCIGNCKSNYHKITATTTPLCLIQLSTGFTMIRNTKYLAWNYHFTFSIYNVLSLIKPSISNPLKGSYSNNNPVLWKQFYSPIDIKNTQKKSCFIYAANINQQKQLQRNYIGNIIV
jgi:hypothetical protein